MQFNFITLPNLILHINYWSTAMRTKKLRRWAWIIWHAFISIILKIRNDRIFNKKIREVEQITVVAWHWSMNRLKIVSYLFYKWCQNLRECLTHNQGASFLVLISVLGCCLIFWGGHVLFSFLCVFCFEVACKFRRLWV